MRIRCSARAISSRWTESTSVSKSGARVRTRSGRRQRCLGLGPRRLRRARSSAGQGHRPLDRAGPVPGRGVDGRGGLRPRGASARGGPAPAPGPALVPRRPAAARRPDRPGPAPAPPSCAAPAGRPSRRAGRRASSASRSRTAGSGSTSSARLGRSAALQLSQPGEIAVARLFGGAIACAAARPRPGRAGRRAQLPELLGDRRHRRVRLVQPGQRHLDGRAASRALLQLALGEPEPLGACGWPRPAAPRRRRSRPGPRSGWAGPTSRPRRSARRARRRRGSPPPVRHGGDQRPGRRRGRRRRPPCAAPADGAGEARRAPSRRRPRSARPAGSAGQSLELLRRPSRTAEQQPGPAEILGLEMREGAERGIEAGHRDRVGRRPEGGRHRRLVRRPAR